MTEARRDGVQRDAVMAVHDGGKISVVTKTPVRDPADLSLVYTPGVARVCMAIHDDPALAHSLTIKRNSVAVVTDGSAVLGLGDIGPAAAMPVMEGKAMLFKDFGGVDAYPICLDERDTDKIVDMIVALSVGFGGINLEDISAPRCFEIEGKLRGRLDIPVFHDDQHGTAVVTLAALYNALRVVEKRMENLRVVISGAGAAGVAITRILQSAGVHDIVVADSVGIVSTARRGLSASKQWLAKNTNVANLDGPIGKAMEGADVFVGVSQPGAVTREDVKAMADRPIVFAMANPIPEVGPDEVDGIAAVYATGRSDLANQINNVLCFPGIFRGALDVQATQINEPMKLAAARAIADLLDPADVGPELVVPSVFHPRLGERVAARVAEAATASGVARTAVKISP
jgi:malate dehydrogenase (oxaloacetate-decarboxylating)